MFLYWVKKLKYGSTLDKSDYEEIFEDRLAPKPQILPWTATQRRRSLLQSCLLSR